MRDVNKIGLGLIFAVLVVFGLYELNSNKMPEGVTDQSTIMSKASKGIDTVLGLDMEMNPYDVSYDGDEYRVFLYDNTKTGKFVFPVKDKKTDKIHYCYLVSYKSTTGASSKYIDNSKWIRYINSDVATIDGDNKAEKNYEYSIYYYYKNYSKLTRYDSLFH